MQRHPPPKPLFWTKLEEVAALLLYEEEILYWKSAARES
jgi:hypothetical protein